MTVNNLEYRGTKSLTYKLVLLGFLTGTALLLFGEISGGQWVTGVLGLIGTYVVKEAASKASEAYRDRPMNNGGKPL